VVGLVLACAASAIVGRSARQPVRLDRRLAVLALLVSLLNPVMARVGMLPITGMTNGIFWTMVAMHVLSAAIAIGTLTTLAVRNGAGGG